MQNVSFSVLIKKYKNDRFKKNHSSQLKCTIQLIMKQYNKSDWNCTLHQVQKVKLFDQTFSTFIVKILIINILSLRYVRQHQ